MAKIGVNGLFFVLSLFGLKKASIRHTTRTIAESKPVSGKWTWKSFKENVLKIGEADNSFSTVQEHFVSEVKVESFTPADAQKPIEVYTDGYARVPKGKIDIYARGHVKKPVNYDNKVEIKKQFRQLKKESPDLITKKCKQNIRLLRNNCIIMREL